MTNKLVTYSLLTVAFLFSSTQFVYSQVGINLTFDKRASFFDEPYAWYVFPLAKNEVVTMISPGGTVVDGSGFPGFEIVSFETFAGFQSDVVGTWQATLDNGSSIQFDVPSFNSTDFPAVQIATPTNGSTFFSGEDFEITLEQEEFEPFATGGSASATGAVDINFLGGTTFEVVLDAGFPSADVVFFRSLSILNDSIITNVTGDTKELWVDPLIVDFKADPVMFSIIPNAVGDVNQDGSIDLKDVLPFVELISSQQFQVEADINGDGVVDLLDVAPFVLLLSGN